MKENPKTKFLTQNITKGILLINAVLIIAYTIFLLTLEPGNMVLFVLLILEQIFFAWQGLNYIYTVWDTEYQYPFDEKYTPEVDVYITVAGEPTEIVRETLEAVLAMDYPNFNAFILNDGYVAKKDNWMEMEELCKELGATCITRKIPGGFKAGNINNAMRETSAEFITIFDADHIPHKDFLKKMMGYFADEKVAFVQSPQYYKNADINFVTKSAWQQQELFFGAICKGKNRLNSVFMCGTNMVLRRTAINEAGGMCETNIAEDFLTSFFVHQNGWKSVYVPEVLAEGLAPEDFLSYYKQQFRWTRGSLEVVFKYNPILSRKLSWTQKIQYLGSAGYYLSGLIVLVNLMFPLFFFFFGLIPIQLSTMTLAMVFLPYILSSLYVLQSSSNFSYTFSALSFSVSSMFLQLKGIYTVLTNGKTSFAVTSKTQVEGNFAYLVKPHFIYISLVIIGGIFAFLRTGLTASFVTNAAWALLNVILFIPFIYASLPKSMFRFIKLPKFLINE